MQKNTNTIFALERLAIFRLAFFLFAMLAFTGCNAEPGAEYIGKWVDIKKETRVLDITRNGDTFTVTKTEPYLITKELRSKNLPVTMVNGVLRVDTFIGPVDMVIDKKTGHMHISNMEFKKDS